MLSNQPQASRLVIEGLVLSEEVKRKWRMLLKNGRDFGVALKWSVITGMSHKDKGCQLWDMPPSSGISRNNTYLKCSSPKTDNYVIIYSPTWLFKPVWFTFRGKQKDILIWTPLTFIVWKETVQIFFRFWVFHRRNF